MRYSVESRKHRIFNGVKAGAGNERDHGRAFSLVELLVSMSILLLLMGMLFSVVIEVSAVWQRMQNEVGSFQAARSAFGQITRTLSQARMAVYEDYDNPGQPTAYLRKSDMHFVIDAPQGPDFGQGNAIFFQVPSGHTSNEATYGGLPGMLNAVGYYVTYGQDTSLPSFLQPAGRNRFRLMQFLVPAENVAVQATSGKEWYQSSLNAHSNVLAENVILLLCWPKLSEGEDPEGDDLTTAYLFDSRQNANRIPQPATAHQQPPLVELTMVVIDQAEAARLPDTATPPSVVNSALEGLFAVSNVRQYQADMASLEKRLKDGGIGYRIFRHTVALRESKWSG